MPREQYTARMAGHDDMGYYDRAEAFEAYGDCTAAEDAADRFHGDRDCMEEGHWPMRIGVRLVLDDGTLGPEQIFVVDREHVPEFNAYPETFGHPKPFRITDYLTRRAYCTRALNHHGDCGDFRDEWDGYCDLPSPPYCQRQLVELRTHEAAL